MLAVCLYDSTVWNQMNLVPSALWLIYNLQEPDGRQVGLRSRACRVRGNKTSSLCRGAWTAERLLEGRMQKEINHRPSRDDNKRAERLWSSTILQLEGGNKEPLPPHLRAPVCWKWNHVGLGTNRRKLMRFWAGTKCNGTPWTFTVTSGRLDIITLNDFTGWVSY